jgi:type II secretory pathway pseudopilin PulG
LVEVIVAMLISCIMVTAMFSVALTTKQGTGKSDRHLIASQAARQITSQLKGFVTGCGCNAISGVCSVAGNDCTMVLGPNTSRNGVATWYFNSPTAVPPITDSMGDVYALTVGVHTISGLLPVWFEGAPYSARVIYTVTQLTTVAGRPVPQVDVNVNWTEP